MTKKIIDFIVKNMVMDEVIEETDEAICRYGLEVFFSLSLMFFSILFLAEIVGKFFETLFFVVSFMSLRIFIGGYHAKSNLKCYFLSLLMYGVFNVVLFIIPKRWYLGLSIIIAIFSVGSISSIAPAIHENRRISSNEILFFREISKKICFIEMIFVIFGLLWIGESSLLFSIMIGVMFAVISMILGKGRLLRK